MYEPINTRSGQKQSNNFGEILQVKAKLSKYLKDECYFEY